MYTQEAKKGCRETVINHAVQCLTSAERSTSVSVKRDYVRRQLNGRETRAMKKEIANWELAQDRAVGTKEASDLRVTFVAITR